MGVDAQYRSLVAARRHHVQHDRTAWLLKWPSLKLSANYPSLQKLWTWTRIHLWGFFSTIFLATCVGALALAIVNSSSKFSSLSGIDDAPAVEPTTIHIGGLTMHVAVPNEVPSGPSSWFQNGSEFDLSLLIPEIVQNAKGPGSNDKSAAASELEWQTQISIAVSSGVILTPLTDDLDDLPGDTPSKVAVATHYRSGSVSALGKCLSGSSAAPHCEGTIGIGDGFAVHYTLSRKLGKTADIKDRVDQIEALLGFSKPALAPSPSVTKDFESKKPLVEVANLPNGIVSWVRPREHHLPH